MCDIFGKPCSVCGDGIPIHISDFCLPRNVIKRVFCSTHRPDDFNDNPRIFENRKYLGFYSWDDGRDYVAYLEIDWEIFGVVVKAMADEADFFGLSHLLSHGAPIELNTEEDYHIAWG